MGTREERALPRAIVFDVDGTLYDGAPVRRGMARRLILGHLTPGRLFRARRVLRGLSAFRKAQEDLRGEVHEDLHRAQLAHAERRSGVPADEIDREVQAWMEDAPLDLVASARQPGLLEFLEGARARGTLLGVLSDYPPLRKLEALGIAQRFTSVRWAQEPGIGAFKPDPRGLLRVLTDLECAPEHALYVGDRPEVDGAVAQAAGVPFALVGTAESDFEALGAALNLG